MAFGGVATGNIKAQDAEMAIKAESTTGDSPSASAIVANTGTRSAALAVLLANSVRKTTKVTTARMVNKMPACSRNAPKPSARNTLVPVAFNTLLKQRPPPNRMSTPQSVVFSMSFHSTARETPSATIAPIATRVSKLLKPPNIALTGLEKIHSDTVTRKIARVIFLPLVHSTGVWSSSKECLRFGLVIE
ncbi:hypothetical protein [Vibrio vulnificus YJ016]|uniref:Uncharacterized protein n=1 Tax=Vibrio vulnificus (strain YJ016) TaxID=196600 RepID=Q7MLG5_VIBVY|nr:hypothetical protein [Vibrio vulnificus YJ016]